MRNILFGLLLALATINFSCTRTNNSDDAIITKGNVSYSFKGAQVQCLSQVDPSGKIFVLLQSLTPNATITPQGVYTCDEGFFLVQTTVIVEQSSTEFNSWKDFQEVTIAIDPIPVDTITLSGTPVYNTERICIFTAS